MRCAGSEIITHQVTQRARQGVTETGFQLVRLVWGLSLKPKADTILQTGAALAVSPGW